MHRTRLDQTFACHNRPAEFAEAYLAYVSEVIKHIDADQVAAFIELLIATRDRGAQVFFIGNGGSAATASHFANDLGVGLRCQDAPLRVISLTDNVASMTAVGNDFGYDQLFVRQLQVLMRPGDVVVAISASGHSANLIAAFDYAKEHEATCVSITGFDGGELRRMADLSVHVHTQAGDYGPAEDAHMVIDHLVAAYLAHYVRSNLASAAE